MRITPFFFFSSRRRHTRLQGDWSSDVCSSDLGAASAQSKVEIFGVVDVGVTHLNGSGPSKTGLSTGGANISRIGFRGTEELGGGLRAGFWLEAGLDVDSGSGKARGGGLGLNRRATA